MRVMISIILMVIAALVGFFFGAGMNEAMGGAILLSMITGFACTISAIEKNKEGMTNSNLSYIYINQPAKSIKTKAIKFTGKI